LAFVSIRPVTHSPLQSETFSAPNAQQAAKGAQSIASYHGYSGPVQVAYPDLMYGGPQQPAFVETIVGLTGINHDKDINGGAPNCVSITPNVRIYFFCF
jgi:choline dehydrogenase